MEKIITGISVLVLLAGGLIYAEGQQEPIPPQDIKAEIAYLEGRVLLNGEPADFGDMVAVGSTVETKDASSCDIVFGRGNIFRIEENTITTISIGPENREIDLRAGAIDAVFGKLQSLGGPEREFRLTTPSIAAGVRGTVFYVKIEDPSTVYFCTCHGKIHQHDPESGIDKTVTSYHHKAYRYSTGSGVTEAVQADMLYHTDEQMDAIAETVDVTIPWNIFRKNYD